MKDALTPNDLHHLFLNKINWSPALEELLKFYSKWDRNNWELFDDYLSDIDARGVESTWVLLQDMGIGIRPVGFEFFVQDQKEEEVQS